MIWEFPGYEIGETIDWDFFEARLDWFREMQDVPQDAIWHAEGDVFTHTKLVVEELVGHTTFKILDAPSKHILFAAAMLHDVEKRSTTKTEIIDGRERIVSPRHAKKGAFTARGILYRDMAAPFAIREQIAKLVRLHGLPLWAIDKTDPSKTVIEASLSVNTEHLSLLAQADVNGRTCADKEDILLKIDLFEQLCKDNDCFGKPKDFVSNHARFLYLKKSNTSLDYTPFDDLDFEVILMSALPGTGKDTYIQQNLNLPVLSLDDIRRERKIDPTDKRKSPQVILLAQEKAKELLRTKTSFVFNATNITRDLRAKWISLFVKYGARVKIIYLEVPYRQMLSQNSNREHKVPIDAIEKLINKLEIPTPSEAHDLEFQVG